VNSRAFIKRKIKINGTRISKVSGRNSEEFVKRMEGIKPVITIPYKQRISIKFSIYLRAEPNIQGPITVSTNTNISNKTTQGKNNNK
jgi:hypothetical protein